MKKLKIYLDASIPSAYYDEREPIRRNITQNWWKDIMLQEYKVYISEITVTELNETTNPSLRNNLLELVKPIIVLNVPEEARDLAQAYIDNEIIPEDYLPDALHIAITTLHGLDILVSWNFKHLVNPVTRRKIKGVNLLKNYKDIDIVSPEELGGDKYE